MAATRTVSRRIAAVAVVAITTVAAAATWTLTQRDAATWTQAATAAPAPVAEASAPSPSPAAQPPPSLVRIDPSPEPSPSPVTPPSVDEVPAASEPTPAPDPSLDEDTAGQDESAVEFTVRQRLNALKIARETVAALETVRPNGTRPDVPNVDPTSWLATTPFAAPPADGLARSVTAITVDIAADGDRTLYIHATWRILDHQPRDRPAAADVVGLRRDFVLEVVHQAPGWVVTDLHPELPLGAGHEHAH